jgi:hypothetical protein
VLFAATGQTGGSAANNTHFGLGTCCGPTGIAGPDRIGRCLTRRRLASIKRICGASKPRSSCSLFSGAYRYVPGRDARAATQLRGRQLASHAAAAAALGDAIGIFGSSPHHCPRFFLCE